MPVYFSFHLFDVFTLFFPYLPTLKFNFNPFSMKAVFYFSTIIVSIPLLFTFLKKSKVGNRIGELSYPVYISHMFVLLVSSALYFNFLKQGWVIAVLTIAFSYLLNIYIAGPVERYRQSRLFKKPVTV